MLARGIGIGLLPASAAAPCPREWSQYRCSQPATRHRSSPRRPQSTLAAPRPPSSHKPVCGGFSAHEGLRIFFSLGGYLGGVALEAQSAAAREEPTPEYHAAMGEALTSDRFPNLQAAANGQGGLDPDTVFDYGLALMLRGIRARHAELKV